MKKLIIAIVLSLLPASARAQTSTQIPTQHTAVGSLEGSHLFSGQAIYSLSITWHTSAARWLMIFDSTTIPGSMAGAPLIFCQSVQGAGTAADGTQNYDWTTHPLRVLNGAAVLLSTNAAACTALTADGANDWIAGQVQ
jgi:hypothetical protein